MDNAPFYVGQKVVCVNPRNWRDMKKGDVFLVQKVAKSKCKHAEWAISINVENTNITECCHCDESYGFHARAAECFAPYNEQSEYADITKELAVFPCDEVLDVKKISEPANN